MISIEFNRYSLGRVGEHKEDTIEREREVEKKIIKFNIIRQTERDRQFRLAFSLIDLV